MNAARSHWALAVVAAGLTMSLAVLALLDGCQAALPEEPPWVETIAASRLQDR